MIKLGGYVMKFLFFNLILFIFVGCNVKGYNSEKYSVVREIMDSLVIYMPRFSSIDLVCGVEPTSVDSSIIFCCAAAFSHDYVEFSHYNIEGNHVSGGKFYEGNPCKVNTGHFVFYEQEWRFVYGLSYSLLLDVADRNWMGFSQAVLIHNGEIKNKKLFARETNFRALCDLDGKLCIVETKRTMKFASFVEAMKSLGVSNSIYLDMGGWAYAWYRNGTEVEELFKDSHSEFMTNWIVFRK